MLALGAYVWSQNHRYFSDYNINSVMFACAALGFSLAQRSLSTPARLLRRRVAYLDGSITMDDGSVQELDAHVLLEPLERALGSLSAH